MPAGRDLTSKIKLLRRELKANGLANTLVLARNALAFDVLRAKQDSNQRRYRLSSKISQRFDSTVQYGPFAGMKFIANSWWSGADRGSMILGFYEQEVLDSLSQAFKNKRTFIDIGAADGYYAIGSLRAGWAERAYCFEISELGQQIIHDQSELNGVNDRVFVYGEATSDFVDILVEATGEHPSDWVILMDIEGGEFDLLTDEVLEQTVGATLVVEVHDFGQNAGRLPELLKRMENFFTVKGICTGARDLSKFEFLHNWSDDDRLLVCSEGRPKLMTWLILTSKGLNH